MKPLRTSLSIVIAAGLAVPSASHSYVQDLPTGEAREILGGEGQPSISEDFEDDIAMLAQGVGQSVESLRQDYAGQEDFLSALTLAYESHPDSYYSAGWSPDRVAERGYTAWVSFTEPINQEVREAFAELPIAVEMRYDAELSENDLEQVRDEAMVQLRQAEGVTAVTADFTENGAIDLVVEVEGQHEDAVDSLFDEVIDNAPVEVDVTATDDLGIEPEAILGGAAVQACTAGFTAHKDGQNAILGAHHCPPDAGVPSGGTAELIFSSGHIGQYGDVRVHTTTDPIDNAIILDPEGVSTREITSRAKTPEGALVCNFGQERGTSDCTTVLSANHSFSAIDPDAMEIVTISNGVQTEADFTVGGDSGGPWYAGNAAMGLHFGQSENLSTFSNILDAEDVLGAQVNTRPN